MDFPERKQIRLKDYDYSTPGAYFVTLCTKDRQQILSKIVGDDIRKNMRSFKILVTKNIGFLIFQRSYFDHVIRNRQDYEETWKYIDENPLRYILKGEIHYAENS